MELLTSFFDYSSDGNLRDGLLHEYILAFAIIWISSIVGLILGWIMWHNRKKQCAKIEAEIVRLRAKDAV